MKKMNEATKKILFAAAAAALAALTGWAAAFLSGGPEWSWLAAPLLSAMAVLAVVLSACRLIKTELWLKLKVGALAAMFVFPMLAAPAMAGRPQQNTENRVLQTEFPAFSPETYGEYPRAVDAYINDTLPFRNELVEAHSGILYGGFHTSPSDQVILGRDGWMYMDSYYREFSDTISDYMGTNLLGQDQLDTVYANLSGLKNYLDGQGIPLYVFVAPSKATVYPEHLPAWIETQRGETTRVREMSAFIGRNMEGLNYYYLEDALLAAKSDDYDLYIDTDSHWNSIGAYVGWGEMMRVMEDGFEPKPFTAEDIVHTREKGGQRDLLNVTALNRFVETDSYVFKDGFLPETGMAVTEGDSNTNIMRIRSNAPAGKKVLMMRDSYGLWFLDYMAQQYGDAVYCFNYDGFTEEFIAAEQPDVVVIEVVERNAANVLMNHLAPWAKYA